MSTEYKHLVPPPQEGKYMTRIIQVTKVQETRLWKILSASKTEDARLLSANVPVLCDEAADRMKAMHSYAPQYTLHDDRHLLRTTELMGILLGDTAERLNIVELTLLILSAFLHDQGMIPSQEEVASIENNQEFLLFRDNWLIEHPNYQETSIQLNSANCGEARRRELAHQLAELDEAMLTEYLRSTHGQRSAELICTEYGNDKRLEIHGTNLAPILARLCQSHTLPCEDLVPNNGFCHDEQVGRYAINMPFLAVVLRLADILDFDRDRTPEVLLKNIHFTSAVSLHEWEKHRSVAGWSISPDLIRFTIKCSHPAYEVAARTYMDWIDRELLSSKEFCRMQPRHIEGYELNLPSHVDRTRIEPLDNLYRAHDLEFALSRDEIVRLLMTDKLYGQEHLCIRELLQNSLDALRYRKALFAETGSSWDVGRIDFRHYIDSDGYEVLECKDNGSGMDDYIIQNYFVRVGRSYYRSPGFDRERNRLKKSGQDFDPCSKFGIGFMSCFMLGDRITVTTRKDYGPGKDWGPPLVVEIHGLSGLLVTRRGADDQPIGTTVSIVCRHKPSYVDAWTDKVKLCLVLKGYALATEFPISAQCDVQEIHESLFVPAHWEKALTFIESAHLKQIINIEQDLSSTSPCLFGYARESLLADSDGIPCLVNAEAEWRSKTENTRKSWVVYLPATNQTLDPNTMRAGVPTCADGILIAGEPGRPSQYREIGLRLGHRNSHIYSNAIALIDVRGELKPELTPARTPPDHVSYNLPPGWQRLQDTFKRALGLLWEQMAIYLKRGLDPEVFWKLCTIRNVPILWISHGTLWDILPVYISSIGGKGCWRLIRDLGDLSVSGNVEKFVLRDREGNIIGPSESLIKWESEGEGSSGLAWQMNRIVHLMCSLDVRNGSVVLNPAPPQCASTCLASYQSNPIHRLSIVEYSGVARDALFVQTPYPSANRNHTLTVIYHESQYAKEPTDIQTFARSFVPWIAQFLSKSVSIKSKPNYWQKRVGHLFFSVQWNKYDQSLHPPYKVWTAAEGWSFITEKDFATWRDSHAKPPDD